MKLDIIRIAAFADGAKGGNPAGVVIADAMPGRDVMQETAAEVGFSETAFAAPLGPGHRLRILQRLKRHFRLEIRRIPISFPISDPLPVEDQQTTNRSLRQCPILRGVGRA